MHRRSLQGRPAEPGDTVLALENPSGTVSSETMKFQGGQEREVQVRKSLI
jgi:hypothetical protein